MLSVAITGTGCGASGNEAIFFCAEAARVEGPRWRPGNYMEEYGYRYKVVPPR